MVDAPQQKGRNMIAKLAMMRAVLGVILDSKSVNEMTDEDFAFVQSVGSYGNTLDRYRVTGEYEPKGATGPAHTVGDPEQLAKAATMPPAAPLEVKPQPEQNELSLDPAPEPTPVGTVLDTSPPKTALPPGAPDYSALTNDAE